MVEAFNCNVEPAQTGPLLLAVGDEGIELTATVVRPAAETQPFIVAVTL